MRYRNILFCFFILSFLLIFSSVSSANDDLNQTTTSQLSSSFENDGDSLENQNVKNNEKISKNIVLNSNSFDEYVTDGKFNDEVSDGDTIDIQGKLDSPRFALNVNKAVNIISSTNDAYLDFDTISTDVQGGYKNGIFQVTNNGSGTNITGITFHNTRVSIENTSNIHLDTVKCINEGQPIGKGVGSITIREGSENITIGDSYFKTYDNAGHSNVVFAAAYNCLFENNTIEGIIRNDTYSMVGNLLYLTAYNVKYANPCTNINITIRNNTLRSINVPSGLATCWGLVLEGTGHVIENNYIDTNYPVKAQYAEVDYGTETNIDEITFNNNIIVRGNPELVFPGTVANNTFGEKATLNQVKAYNNSFNNVTINNNCIFENNEARDITIIGSNNILRTNEVYSNEDYAVTVRGENNTLSDNKFAGYLGRGENSINNSTEIVLINNSEEISRVFYFEDDNLDKYFDIAGTQHTFKTNIFKSNDILVFNRQNNTPVVFSDTRGVSIKKDYNLTVINSHDSIVVPVAKLTVINCTLLDNLGGTAKEKINVLKTTSLTLINSTIGQIIYPPTESINSTWYYVNKELICPENTYIFINVADDFTNEGMLVDSVTTSSNVLIYRLLKVSSLTGDLYVNKDLNISAIPTYGFIDYDIHFDAGSAGTTVTGITFNGKVYVDDNNIKFINCTFNQGLELSSTVSCTLDGNIINGSVTINSSNNLMFRNNVVNSEDVPINIINSRLLTIENNTITTTGSNTINFDESSTDSLVKDNVLISNSFVGDETVIAYDNDVEDNTPPYNTTISINSEELMFKDGIQKVDISVFNLYNDTPVTKGYVEVYFDGILQCIKPLADGQISVDISANKSSSGNKPIKVWYYDGIKYANKVSSNNVDIEKSNVTIVVDEFTARFNEKTSTNITFLNQKGNPVQDTNVTVTVATTTYTLETVNGVAILEEQVTKEWLDSGRMTITFPDNDLYNRNTTTITLNTSKADVLLTPEVTVDGSTANIKLTYTDDLQQNVSDGRVSITTLDGTQLASGRVQNGVYSAIVTLPEGFSDEYLVANFTGSYYYNDLVRNIKLSGMLNSTITIETNSPVYGEELIITGKLVDSRNNAIKDTDITVNINGVKEVISTDADGNYTYSILPELGVNTITVSFDGNSDVYATSATKDITIRDTDHDMNEVLNQLDELTAENARLQEQLDNLTQLSNDLKEQLANQTGELSEQNAALQQQIDTLTTIIGALTDIINSQNEQINSLNEQIAALTAPENTTIIFNDVVDVRYKSDVVISGMLTSQKGMALSGQTVTLTIGDKTVDVITKNGEFEYTTVFKSVGEQTITASYAGSDNYVASDASVTFDVAKQDVVVTVDPIADSAYGDNVTITGKFSDVDGKAISNSNVRVFVNGKKFLAKTDKTGTYTLSVKVNAVGENNVTVAYAGNDNYNSYEDTTTFNADKQDVIVTVNAIEDTKVGENVTITGTFTDKNGKAIINSNVKITINGKKYYARTDSTGSYTFTTTVTSAGINNVTVGYSGNDKYNSYEDVTTFNVGAQDVLVTVNPIEDTVVGENVTITGTFTDKYGKAIINSNVKITVNGKKYYARTDSTGLYTFTTTVTTEGNNNITAGYAGSAKYNAYETSTTFIAKAE